MGYDINIFIGEFPPDFVQKVIKGFEDTGITIRFHPLFNPITSVGYEAAKIDFNATGSQFFDIDIRGIHLVGFEISVAKNTFSTDFFKSKDYDLFSRESRKVDWLEEFADIVTVSVKRSDGVFSLSFAYLLSYIISIMFSGVIVFDGCDNRIKIIENNINEIEFFNEVATSIRRFKENLPEPFYFEVDEDWEFD